MNLTEAQKKQVRLLKGCGLSDRQTAARAHCSKTSVQREWGRAKAEALREEIADDQRAATAKRREPGTLRKLWNKLTGRKA